MPVVPPFTAERLKMDSKESDRFGAIAIYSPIWEIHQEAIPVKVKQTCSMNVWEE